MGSGSESLEKVQQYAAKIKATEYHTASSIGVEAYEAQLERTLTDLESRVEREERSLAQLKSQAGSSNVNHPSLDPSVRLQQLRTITSTYQSLTPLEPQLPPSNSSIPALLAIRKARKLVSEIRDLIPSTRSALSAARKDLSKEQSDLEDASLLASALEGRIARLHNLAVEKSERTTIDIAGDLIRTEKERKDSYNESTKGLFLAMIQFVDTTLAPMLAAEELGGPVAGSTLDINDDTLATGYTAKGKVKKSKTANNEENRQRRIDHIWPLQNALGEQNEGPDTESKAAAREMKALVEDLLNMAVEQGARAYMTLERESAASRFLVRAKAAMLHPRDAMRIRLVDFGRTLED